MTLTRSRFLPLILFLITLLLAALAALAATLGKKKGARHCVVPGT